MRVIAFASALLAAGSATAQDGPKVGEFGYEHYVVTMFRTEPCGIFIATIDDAIPRMMGRGLIADGSTDFDVATGIVKPVADMGIAFGILLGLEIENPQLRRLDATPLERLRENCRTHPEKTAMAIVRDMIAE